MVALSNFVAQSGWWAAIVAIALVMTVLWMARRPSAAPLVHRLYVFMPITRSVSRTLNLARFSMVFGSLLKSGIPIALAVNITSTVLGNVLYRQVLKDAVARVETGEPLSSVLEESSLFPPFATRMIVVGEQTGKLEEMMFYLSDFYETQLDTTLKNLSTIIEPAMLVAIGLLVAAVALSIISPIYNFIGAIA